MASSKIFSFSSLLLFTLFYLKYTQSLETGVIYSLDNIADEQILSLEVRDGLTISAEQNDYIPEQRFIARINNDNTFHLFLESQPWNWVNHIVESSLTINIKQAPKTLDVQITNGVKEVIQSDYKGSSNTGQKWYNVPVGNNSNIGLVTNLLHRQCIVANGLGNTATLGICNQNDANQIFRLTRRTEGRCY